MSLDEKISTIRSLAAQGKTQDEIALAVGLEIGDVGTVLANLSMPGVAALSGAGSPVIHKFPFAHDTPGLASGVPVYTPTLGEILLDAWFEIDTPWNGVTPQADLSALFSNNYGSVDLTRADFPSGFILNEGLANDYQAPPTSLSAGAMLNAALLVMNHATDNLSISRYVPGKFIVSDPLLVWVTRNGAVGGSDPGATQGSAVLYLSTVIPA